MGRFRKQDSKGNEPQPVDKEKATVAVNAEPYPEQKKGTRFPEDLAGEVWGTDIDSYPVRDKSEDPKWATNIVWIWIGLASFVVVFFMIMMILGAILD